MQATISPKMCLVAEQPSGLKGATEGLERASRTNVELLEQLLSQKHEFVDHPRLHEDGIEDELFGKDFDDAADDPTRGPVPSAPPRYEKMTAAQEGAAFLRYNLARRWIVQLLASRGRSEAIPISLAEELVRWYRRVLVVRSEIVNANFPLVMAMAKHSRFTSLDVNEMVSEGNMALLRSIDKFDLSRGFRFSSYACRSILKAFSRVALKTSRYYHRFGTEHSEVIEPSDDHGRRQDEDHQHMLGELQLVMDKNVAHLNDVERRVIVERFALHVPGDDEGEPKTLCEVGQMIGLTKERVRQIQNRALEKLRIAMANRFAAA